MKQRVLEWADGKAPTGAAERLLSAGLRAASFGWRAGASARGFAYDVGLKRSRHPGGRVISVGNLSVGGTGKTPLVIEAARFLLSAGERVSDGCGLASSFGMAVGWRSRFGSPGEGT